MEKRIFRSMSLLVLLTVLFFAMLWGVSIALRLPDEAKQGLKDLRVTVLDETGQVLFDSERNPGELENHIDRAEVQQAISAGWGESERFSDTLGRQNYYYAKVMEDGRILRVSYASDTLTDRLTRLLPGLALSIAAALAFSWLLARRLTRSIVDPINGLDLFGPQPKGYDELLPLYRRIEAQRRELSRRIGETEGRNATIAAIMENMREGLLLLDEIGRVILANDSVLRLFGQKEAAGKSVLLLHRDPVFTAEVKRCLEGHKAECTLQLKGRTYQVLLNPVYQDKLNGGVVLFIDVTERQRAELQRKEFSANVSHELKTPLTTISVLSELMADGKVPPEDIRPFAGRVKQQSDRLVNIVNDIIRLSAFDEGKAEGRMEPVNILRLCEGVADSLREKAAQRGVSLRVEGKDGLTLLGSKGMLDEMVYNLADNAVQYNREGGSVTLSFMREGNDCLIRVRDTGIGIAPMHLGHIFERFYRADKSRSKKTGGTGLGLSIVKHVAEYHGGRVEVESTEGEGSLFTCRLPIKS